MTERILGTGIKRFYRKPELVQADRGLIAAQYIPGQPLDDLRKVAALAYEGEAAECVLPSGTVLVARYTDIPDDYLPRPDYAVVVPRDWLYYSESYGSLGDDTSAGIAQFYEEVPGGS